MIAGLALVLGVPALALGLLGLLEGPLGRWLGWPR